MQLKALKALKYRTRRMLPGDVFDVDDGRDGRIMAKVLVATRRAKEHRTPGRVAAPPAPVVEKLSQLDHEHDGGPGGSVNAPQTLDLTALREEYFRAVGKRPFNGWDAATLRQKIDGHASGQE